MATPAWSADRLQRMPLLALLLASTLLGCSAAPVGPASSWVGQSEAEVREAYASRAIDSGVVYWGGSGRRTLYIALDDGTQVWFDLDFNGTVENAGGPQPKVAGSTTTVMRSPWKERSEV